MSILDARISTFNSTRDTEVRRGSIDTVGFYLDAIKNGDYKEDVLKVRAGDTEVKKNLPTFAFHGIFKDYRKAADFLEATGLIILDIDDIEDDLEEVKADIMDCNNNVLACMVGPSGDGVKVLYYIEPSLVTKESYRQIGKQLVSKLDTYGKVDFLSVTDCLIATWDENILINPDAVPGYIYVADPVIIKKTCEPRDESKPLWDNVEDFFDTVLAQSIQEKTNNNFHFIQVAVLDLAKFGFRHPADDLSFVVDYAEEAFKSSPENHKRFLEVVEVAKNYPQLQWAYKTTREANDVEYDDEAPAAYDYSEYSNINHKSSSKESEGNEETDEDSEGLVDYDGFYERILTVAREGDRVGYEISLKNFSDIFRFRGSGILTVTGIPGHGKTEFIDECILDLARLYGHQTIVAGFEQSPEEHVIKLSRKLIGTNVTCPSYLTESNLPTFKSAVDYITGKIKHIDTTREGGNIVNILKIAAKTIKQLRDNGGNPRYVVIDPFNMLSIKSRLSSHEKIEEILRLITHFSHQMEVLVILVAHPFKMKKDENGKYEIPDFYAVKGSSAFFEMSYHGLVVYRMGYKSTDTVLVRVLKVKQSNLGQTGEEAFFQYDSNSTRYIPIDQELNENSGDHRGKDWLVKALEQVNNNSTPQNE
jgi:hypothetical protein